MAPMDLRHLVTFETILSEGSFSKAARAQGYSQSTVTLHVQELEKELGVPLFLRRGRHTSLSEAGSALASRCRPVLDGLDSLKRTMAELQAGESGELRLGAIEPAATRRLLPVLSAFCRERPGLRVRLEVGGTVSVGRQVAAGQVDIGLCSPPAAELQLRFQALYEERMGLLIPRRHPLARRRRIRARDLDGERLMLTDQGCAYRKATEVALRDAGANVECRIEIGGLQALVRAVQYRVGMAIVPVEAARPTPAGTVLRSLIDVDLSLQVGLARRAGALLASPAVSAFVSRLESTLVEKK